MPLRQWVRGIMCRSAEDRGQARGKRELRHELDVLAQDLRYNVRVIRRAGPLSIAVVLTLIVGLGINSIAFSLFNGLLFRPWATRDPDSFVHVYARPSGSARPASDGPDTMVTLEDFTAIRSDTRTLSAVTAERWASFRLGEGDGDGISLRGVFVSCNFLSAHLGPMQLGRGLLDSDCSGSGREPVVVVTKRGWNRYFASDPNIIGRTLRLNDNLLTVVGVAPDDAVGGPIAAMLYVPYTMQPVLYGPTDYFREPAGLHAWLNLAGRLAPGHTISQAGAELAVIARSLDRLHPGRATGLQVTDGAIIHEPNTVRTMPLLFALCVGTTVLILLMVCANVTTLLLARAVARRQEMAIRLALGGSRSRLLRQLLTETIALASFAGLGSIALACYVPQYVAERLSLFPLLKGFAPDWHVFAGTLGLALLAGCVAGVSPAMETLRVDIITALRGAGSGGGPAVSPTLRGTLIANQLSISLALLIVIGVIVRTQDRLVHTTLDYDANATIVTTVDLSHSGYSGPLARAFYDRLVPSLQALPSVRAVALASPPPFSGMPRTSFSLDTAPGRTLVASFRCVTPEYFAVTGVHVLAGRLFSDLQARTPAQVMPIVVSDSFARTFFRGVEAVGGRIRFGNDDLAQIVAVVRDTSSLRPTEPDEPMIYQPIYSAELTSLAPVLRVDGDPRPVMQGIRAEVLRLDQKSSARPETVAMIIAGAAGRYDAVIDVIAIPAMLALFLSVIGIYGLTAFAAAQRTHEMGVRVALGASRRDIVVLFFWSLRWPFVFGVAGGCVCAGICVAILRSVNVLANGSSLEPSAYGLSIVVLLFTASVATLLPAIRAARGEPWSSLRDH
ncbi:MAG TPA: ABC transporter permease [Vicinamibacterales bacterium]